MKGKSVDVWYFESSNSGRQKKGIYSPHKALLYEVIHRSLTQHNMAECRWVLKLLPRMTIIDPFVIFRFVMIMIHSVDEELINTNFMIYLEDLFSKLELSKQDVFLEILTYFLSKNRIEDARELFNLRHGKMKYRYHRNIPLVDLNVGCYDLLFNYLAWKERLPQNTDVKFDVSIQGWLVNAMQHLKSTNSNHEVFVMSVARVLLYYGFHRKAYLFLSEFQRTNPDNITAQLLLFNLIKSINNGTPKKRRSNRSLGLRDSASGPEEVKDGNRLRELEELNNFTTKMCNTSPDLDDFPVNNDKKSILNNLLRLDPCCEAVLELSESCCDRLNSFRLLMDSLENLSEIRRASRWRYLDDMLESILKSCDESLIDELKQLWQTRYFPFWRLEDFLFLAADGSSPDAKLKHRKVIRSVFHKLSSKFDPVESTPKLPEEKEPFLIEEYYDIDDTASSLNESLRNSQSDTN